MALNVTVIPPKAVQPDILRVAAGSVLIPPISATPMPLRSRSTRNGSTAMLAGSWWTCTRMRG